MSPIPWEVEINFASALLLHSCITILIKESLNVLEVSRRLSFRLRDAYRPGKPTERVTNQIITSIVLDGYTSIFSYDVEATLSELYFTNTGFFLLAISLASSVAMNLLLSSKLLNTIIACTFGLAFLASLAMGEKEVVLPILAIRRAGRFIWSDTPFVNFFSLIYIATVLQGRSTLRLQDYVTFRSIAVAEAIFMKAQLAASSPEKQTQLLRQLIASEWVVLKADVQTESFDRSLPLALRDDMIPFTTAQRLSVMLCKTAVGFHFGCLQGSLGPASCQLPDVGFCLREQEYGCRVYRLSEDTMLLADHIVEPSSVNRWRKFILKTHGILLRQLGRVRVIYLQRTRQAETSTDSIWHTNINLVTGVKKVWLDEHFRLAPSHDVCMIA